MALRLSQSGHRVISLQRSSELIAGVDETISVGDFNVEAISERLRNRRFDRLFHFAGYGVRPADRDPAAMYQINVALTQLLVTEAATWAPKALFVAGSGSEYDTTDCEGPVAEDHPLECRELYGSSKAAGTLCAIATATALNLPLAVGRLFGIYGPGESPHRLLPTLFRHLSQRERVPLSPGNQLRDFLYIDDVVSAAFALSEYVERTGAQIAANVASGDPVTIRLFAETAAEQLNASKSLLGFGDLPLRPGETKCFSGDPHKIKTLTGWQPHHDLNHGIRCTITELCRRL